MNNVYDLKNFGFDLTIELIGNVTFLRTEIGLPIVFLFDEHHGNLNNCIDKNIVNAIELIYNGNVVLVGVESLAGGKSWDIENRIYSDDYPNKKFDDLFIKEYKSSVTKFADEVKKVQNNSVCGVECYGMTHIISEDISLGNYHDVKTHPLNIERSKHFLQTLFENDLNNGNLILNCGSDHITHIEEWILSEEIDNIAGYKANYIRINNII
jgi:hypothetical protein